MQLLTQTLSALAACLACSCCFAQNTVGDIRLVDVCSNTANSTGGVVEVFLNGVGWSTVSGSQFGELEAQVVCVQLGYLFMESLVQADLRSDRPNSTYVRSVQCSGQETSVAQCDIQQEEQVIPGLVAHVTCNTAQTTTEDLLLIVFENLLAPDPDGNFTNVSLIDPANNFYLERCNTSLCYGSHLVNSTDALYQILLALYGGGRILCEFINELNVLCDTSTPPIITTESCSSGAVTITSSATMLMLMLAMLLSFKF